MSFHNTEFHETKRERKYYEDKKQKALRFITHTLDDLYYQSGITISTRKFLIKKITIIKKMVNDI